MRTEIRDHIQTERTRARLESAHKLIDRLMQALAPIRQWASSPGRSDPDHKAALDRIEFAAVKALEAVGEYRREDGE